jgi:hypothetical protein
MKAQKDDMWHDLYAHGARELVSAQYAANNHQRLLEEEDEGAELPADELRHVRGANVPEVNERRLAANVRQGMRCHKYDAADKKFVVEYTWQHCVGMKVGETYEVHWPHSKIGACGTPNQFQTPFYDGVFCHIAKLNKTHTDIGVQAQIFTIVNDEAYYYPDLMYGMIVDGVYGLNITRYTGSTTGTTRSNTVCSKYAPITWQVDRTCHLISASSFDKMCADMKAQRDDMSSDLYAHGSRMLVSKSLAAGNHRHHWTRPSTGFKRLLEGDDMAADEEELQSDDKPDDVTVLDDNADDLRELQSSNMAGDVVDSLEANHEERRLAAAPTRRRGAAAAGTPTNVFTARRRACAKGICSRVTLKIAGIIQQKGPVATGKAGWIGWEKWMNSLTSKDCLMDFDGGCVRVKITWMHYPLDKMNYPDFVNKFTNKTVCKTDCADAIIPPYSSGETSNLIMAMPHRPSIPVMVWGGADPAVFTHCGTKQVDCFGTLPHAGTYTKSSLDKILFGRGTSFLKMAAIASKTGFGRAVHAGTKAWATTNSKTVTEHYLDLTGGILSANDVKSLTTLIVTGKPQVVAIAGHPAEVQAVIKEVRKLDTGKFVKEIVATNAWSDLSHLLTTNSVGVLNGVTMPDPMDRRAETTKLAYGITDMQFRSLVGHDSYHAASAFVSGLAITQAVKLSLAAGKNPCAGKKPASGFENFACRVNNVVVALEQSGVDVTVGVQGTNPKTAGTPIQTTLAAAGLCPVNVHWHLGAEHRSTGQYDESGVGPAPKARRLSATARQGLRCKKYNAGDPKFTTPYAWRHCKGMQVGATYEIHWPHSAAGACSTPHQYQTPFYDGVFCRDGFVNDTDRDVGVHAQVFTVVNDVKLMLYRPTGMVT